jgi:hypothetical protein
LQPIDSVRPVRFSTTFFFNNIFFTFKLKTPKFLSRCTPTGSSLSPFPLPVWLAHTETLPWSRTKPLQRIPRRIANLDVLFSGDQGGNGTALGIKGAVVARFGANSQTEKDTTVFGGDANNPMTDGLGKTTANGKLTVSDLADTMALSGSTLPQVSGDGTGSINGTWRIVTSDGTAIDKQGKLFAVIDPTGTGKYSKGVQTTATSDMVGNGQGNVVQRAVARALRAVGIQRRATNVGADAVSEAFPKQTSLAGKLTRSSPQPFSVKIPSGLTCTGTDATSGQSNFCLMKVANNNGNGPFGGNIAFQIAGASTSTGNTTAATTQSTKSTKSSKSGKREQAFQA